MSCAKRGGTSIAKRAHATNTTTATTTGVQRGVLLERAGRVSALPGPDAGEPGLLQALHGHLHRLAGVLFAAAAEGGIKS